MIKQVIPTLRPARLLDNHLLATRYLANITLRRRCSLALTKEMIMYPTIAPLSLLSLTGEMNGHSRTRSSLKRPALIECPRIVIRIGLTTQPVLVENSEDACHHQPLCHPIVDLRRTLIQHCPALTGILTRTLSTLLTSIQPISIRSSAQRTTFDLWQTAE